MTTSKASDRFNINSQLEHLQAKYVGTGHADMNRDLNIQRGSYASYVGHHPILSYFAIAENESVGRERYNFMQGHQSKKPQYLLIIAKDKVTEEYEGTVIFDEDSNEEGRDMAYQKIRSLSFALVYSVTENAIALWASTRKRRRLRGYSVKAMVSS
ncbi:hypothetical protein AgCh_028895 [Apium graveolens]